MILTCDLRDPRTAVFCAREQTEPQWQRSRAVHCCHSAVGRALGKSNLHFNQADLVEHQGPSPPGQSCCQTETACPSNHVLIRLMPASMKL